MWDLLPYTSYFDPWLWLTFGVIFLLAELLIPGYFLLSFGLSAIFIAAGTAVIPNVFVNGTTLELSILLVVWTLLSLFIWLFLAKIMVQTRGDKEDINNFQARVEGTDPSKGMPERDQVKENHTDRTYSLDRQKEKETSAG